MKKSPVCFSFITTLLIITGSIFNATNNTNNINDSESTLAVSNAIPLSNDDIQYDIVDYSILLPPKYDSISELKKDSDIIIEGTVKDTSSRMIGDVPYTVSKIEIIEIFKNDGTVEKNTEMCFIETGGIFSRESLLAEYKKKFPNKSITLKDIIPTKLIVDGIAPLNSNEHVIIFGRQTPPLDGKPCYGAVGEYQGKYILEDDNWKQQIPKNFEEGYKDRIKTKKEMADLLLK